MVGWKSIFAVGMLLACSAWAQTTLTDVTTSEDTLSPQTGGGLVFSTDVANASHFKVLAITNGTLFLNDGTTSVAVGSFVTTTNGNAGLRFLPSANLNSAASTFTVQVQTAINNFDAALVGGETDTANITVNAVADTPSVSNATTNEDTQTTSGLVISRNANDGAETTHFKITSITNGSLFQNNGTTQINDGDFIDFAAANAGLKFTPSTNFFGTGSFVVQASVSNGDAGLGGSTVSASITVNAVADTPGVTNATTNEDTQTTSGLVISRNAGDGAEVTHFKILTVTNGTLFLNDGTTAVAAGSFITFAEGNAGLKFTPSANLYSPSSTFGFTVRASLSNVDAGLGGGTATASVTVNPVADTPSVTNATTNEDTQTTSGLVISRNANDGAEVTHFKITNIANGSLFQNNGTTQINDGDFITFNDGNAGLKFTPSTNFFGSATFDIRASVSNGDAGLGGATITATITVNAVADTPSVTNATTNEDTQTTSGLVISRNAGDGAEVTHFKITNITNGTLFLNDGATTVAAGSFITFAEGNAGLKFTPSLNLFSPGSTFSFDVRASLSNVDAGLGGSTVTATITVNAVNDAPVITGDLAITALEGNTGIAPTTLTTTDLNENDPDDSGAGLTYVITAGPSRGIIELSSAPTTPITSFTQADLSGGTVRYRHDGSENFTDSFTVRLEDGGEDGVVFPTATVNVTITPINDPPSVTNVDNPSFDEVTLRTAQILDSNVTVTDDLHASSFGGGSLAVTYSGPAGTSRETLGVATTASISTTVMGPNVRVFFTGDPFHFATYANNGGGSGKNGNSLSISLLAASGTTSAATTAKVEALLEAITYASTESTPPATRTLSFTLNDGGGTANGGDQDTSFNIVVSISAVNDAPVVTATGAVQSTNEDTPFFLAGSPSFSVDDPEAVGADQIDIVITATNGTVLLKNNVTSGITAGQITNNGTATVTVTNATETQINNTLADTQGIQFSPTLNFNGTASVTVTADDNGISGSGGVQTGFASVSITVNAVNDQPVRTAPAGSLDVTVLEGFGTTSLNLGTLAFSPGGGTDENGQTLTYTITAIPPVSVGSVRIAPATDVTPAMLPLTLTSVADLQGLSFIANNVDANGSGTLTFTIQDNGGTALGGVDTLTENLLITVTAVNDVPVITDPTDPVAVLEDAGSVSVPLVGLTFDAGPTDEDGTQVLAGYNIVSVTSSGNIAFTVLPSISNAGVLSYTLAANTNGSATVTFNAQDNGGTANGGVDTSANQSFVITVTAVNDAPVNTVPGAQTFLEDSTSNALSASVTVADLDILELPATFSVTATLTRTLGVGSPGALTASSSGTATVGGTAQALTITGGSAADTNTVLASLRYTPPAGEAGAAFATLTIDTSDNAGTGIPGAQTDTDVIVINITAVNDAPVLTETGVAAAYAENSPAVAINAVTLTDEDSPDFAGGSVSVAITANGENATDVLEIITDATVTVAANVVSVNGSAVGTVSGGTGGAALTLSALTANSTPANLQAILQRVGFRSTSERPTGLARTITYTVVDGDGTANGGLDTDTATATVNVTPINDAPVIALSAVNTYVENAAGALVGILSVTDPDSDDFTGGSLTLAITNINEAGDVLEVATDATVSVTGGVVAVGGVDIATVTGGTAGAPLAFGNFTANTTPVRLTEVLTRIRYRTTSERPPETARTVLITMVDGDGTANGGVDTGAVSKTVNVDEVNDPTGITSSNKTPIFTFDTSGAVNTIAGVALPGQAITFTIDAKDTDDPITFLWDFGDGSTDAGTTTSNNVLLNDGSVVNFSGNVVTNTVTHTFAKSGIYSVKVAAKDGRGPDDTSVTVQILVNSPPRISTGTGGGGATPPETGLIALTDFLKLGQPQTYTVLLAGLSSATDEDGDPLTFTFDLGDGTTTTVGSNTVDTSYPLLPQTAVLQPNGLSSIIVGVTVTDTPQTPGLPAGSLQLTRQIFFTEPIVGAAVDDIDVFNPTQGLTALGINSQGNRGAVIQFDVVNAKNPVLKIIPLGQETGAPKDFYSPALETITGLSVRNAPAGTFRFFVQFKKAGMYLAQITDSDGRIVRKMIPVTVPDITGAQRELQDFNVASSFITGKLNFTGGKDDQLKFRARFPLVDNSLYTFDKTKEFELVVGIGNIAVTLSVPPKGNAKIMAIRDAQGNIREPGKGSQVRFKAPKSTKQADADKNPKSVQAVVDFRLSLADIDIAGLDSEGVTQEHGTVANGETVLNTGGLLGGSQFADSKIDVGETGVTVNTVEATLKKNNLVPIGIQTLFLIDRQLAYASKIPAGFVAKKNFGQLAGKK